MNEFAKHFEQNRAIYGKMVENGLISKDDIKIAGNLGGKYSDEDQQNATDRIRNAAKNLHEKNPDHQMVSSFYTSFPSTKFTPNKEDWQSYNNDQMAELAKTMKFNWKNKDDRAAMLKELSDVDALRQREQAVNEDYSYLGMDKDNPINKGLNWLADKIISEDTKNAIIEDPSNTSRIVGNAAVDIAGTAADFMPGLAGVFAGPTLRTTRDIAEGKSAGTVTKNALKDYGLNAVVGYGLKGVPGMADDVSIFKGAARKFKDTLGKWGDKVETANKKVSHAKIDVKPSKNIDEFQKQIDNLPKEYQQPYEDVLSQSGGYKNKTEIEQANKKANDERLKHRREQSHAQKWVKQNKGKVTATRTFAQTGAGAARVTGRSWTEKEKQAPTIEQVFASPEMAEYIRLKRRGFSPQIPDKFKEYKQQVDAIINDPNLNLR